MPSQNRDVPASPELLLAALRPHAAQMREACATEAAGWARGAAGGSNRAMILADGFGALAALCAALDAPDTALTDASADVDRAADQGAAAHAILFGDRERYDTVEGYVTALRRGANKLHTCREPNATGYAVSGNAAHALERIAEALPALLAPLPGVRVP